jgi:RNA polymerase primary sigma factor
MLERYLKSLQYLPPLSAGKEAELTHQIQRGDRKALAKLLKGNRGFVVEVVKKFRGHGLPLADLVDKGNVGLMKAAQRFDSTKGYKFSCYAVLWIRQAIMGALAKQSQNRQQRR